MVKLERKYATYSLFESYSAYLEAQADFDRLRDKLGDEYFNKWMAIKDKIGDKIKDPDWARTSPEEQPKFIPNPDRKYKNIYNILKFNDIEIEELKDFLDNFQSKASMVKQNKIEGAEEIYNKDGWTVYRITTYKAAQKYGSGTKWCITGRYDGQEEKGEYYFDKYIREQNLDGGYYFYIHNSDQDKFCVLRKKNGEINSIWNAADKEIDASELPKDFPSVPISGLEELSYIDPHTSAIRAIRKDDMKMLNRAISVGLKKGSEDGEIELLLSDLLDIALHENKNIIPQIIKLFIVNSPSQTEFYDVWMDAIKDFIKSIIKGDTSSEESMEILDNVLSALELDYSNENQSLRKFFTHLYDMADKSIIPRIVKSFGKYLNFDSNDVYNELLIKAIEHDDIDTVKELFNYDTDQDYTDDSGKPAIAYAIESKDADIVKLLLDYDAYVDMEDEYIQKALSKTTQDIKTLISDYTKENNMIERKSYINEVDCVEEGLFSKKYTAEEGEEFAKKLKDFLGYDLNNKLNIRNDRNREFYVLISPKWEYSDKGNKDTLIDGHFLISGKDNRNMYLAAYHEEDKQPFKSIQKIDISDLRLIRGFIQTHLKDMLEKR